MKMKLKNFLALIIVTLIAINSYSQTAGSVVLSAQDKQNSKTFIKSKGKNRLVVFNQLKNLIKTNAELIYSKTKFALTTQQEVIVLLGQPDKKTSPYTFEYNLDSNGKGCLVVISFNENGEALNCSVYDCN